MLCNTCCLLVSRSSSASFCCLPPAGDDDDASADDAAPLPVGVVEKATNQDGSKTFAFTHTVHYCKQGDATQYSRWPQYEQGPRPARAKAAAAAGDGCMVMLQLECLCSIIFAFWQRFIC